MTELNIPLFSSHIERLNLTLHDFQSLLEIESQHLKDNDVTSLSETSKRKSELSDQIETLVKKIEHDLPDNLGNQHFFELAQKKAFLSLSPNLQANVDISMALSQACHDLNLANGMAIQILSNMNQVSLKILTGQNQTESKLYGSSGSTTQNKTQSSLGKA